MESIRYKSESILENPEIDESKIKRVSEKLINNFGPDEVVQVAENYVEGMQMKELQELLLKLFDERSKALRDYIQDLMKHK